MKEMHISANKERIKILTIDETTKVTVCFNIQGKAPSQPEDLLSSKIIRNSCTHSTKQNKSSGNALL